MKDEKHIDWLKKYKHLLNISAIEKEVDCPASTIKHYLNNKRDLPEKWKGLLINFIIDFRK